MAADGHILSDNHSHADYMGRSLLQLCSYVLRQVNASVDMRVDATKFLGAFSYLSDSSPEQGNRVALEPWPLGPGYQSYPPPFSRQQESENWELHKFATAEFIPNHTQDYQRDASDAVGRREHYSFACVLSQSDWHAARNPKVNKPKNPTLRT